MTFVAEIDIMPLDNLLDPQGKAVKNTLHSLNFTEVEDVRIGKHITLKIQAQSLEQAKEITLGICEKVLVNPIVQKFSFKVEKAE